MPVQTERSGVSADYNQVTFLYEANEKDFFCPILDDYHPSCFESPLNANAIADKIIQRRLIILGGDTSSDKQTLARHFAWLIREKIALNEAQMSTKRLPVYEWKQSGARFIDLALETYADHCIFILPNLLPQHINYNLGKLYRITNQRHIIIITCDNERLWRETFLSAADEKRLLWIWENIGASKLYDRRQLTRTLVVKILERRAELPSHIINNITSSTNLTLVGGIRVEHIAVQLETPENIVHFVTLLCYEAEQSEITEDIVRSCVRSVRDDTRKLQQWYNTVDMRDRLLILALNFFDGLMDDQFFASLELLIAQEWHRRDPSLRALDYYDFERLQQFFDYVALKEGRGIKTKLRNQRQILLKIAWKSYRRHILSARSVFYNLVKRSVEQQADNWELYGNSVRRDQLRKTISETISDIGLESSTAIEDVLLRMAIDPHAGVQAVAARAVARWREYGASEITFDTLKRWVYDEDIEKNLKTFLSEEDQEQRDDPKTYLKCTVALAIGYAAQADRPSHIHPFLYQLLERLSAEKNQLVLTNLCSYTLPMVAPLHLEQVQDIVLTLTGHVELHDAIAASLRAAYFKQPAEVCNIVEQWHDWCLRNDVQAGRRTAVGRPKLLACVARVYGVLPYDTVAGGMTVEKAFFRLREILDLVETADIRAQALRSVIGLSRQHFTELQHIISSVTDEEMAQIVDKLVEIYLEQRATLQGGERRWYHKPTGRYYPVWLSSSARPLTIIESEMFDWILTDHNAVAQQIGVRAHSAFIRSLNLAEARFVWSLRRSRRRKYQYTEPEQLVWREQRVGLYSRSILKWYIIPWLVASGSKRYRSIIRGLLPEVLLQHEVNDEVVRLLLAEWQIINDRDIPEIALRLGWAIFWNGSLGRWLLAGSLLLIWLVIINVANIFFPSAYTLLLILTGVLFTLWIVAGIVLWWKREQH